MEHGLSAVKWDQFSDSCVDESQVEALSPKQQLNDFFSPSWAHEPNDGLYPIKFVCQIAPLTKYVTFSSYHFWQYIRPDLCVLTAA